MTGTRLYCGSALPTLMGQSRTRWWKTSLIQHHVPDKIRDLILNYYSCFNLRVTSGSTTSAFHRLEKGIISVILFAVAMNMLVKSAEVEYRGLLTQSGV